MTNLARGHISNNAIRTRVGNICRRYRVNDGIISRHKLQIWRQWWPEKRLLLDMFCSVHRPDAHTTYEI